MPRYGIALEGCQALEISGGTQVFSLSKQLIMNLIMIVHVENPCHVESTKPFICRVMETSRVGNQVHLSS